MSVKSQPPSAARRTRRNRCSEGHASHSTISWSTQTMPDDRLQQYIRDLEQRAEPNPDFEERLFAELGGTPRRRPMRWPVLLAAAAITVIAVAGGAVAGGWVGQLANHRSPQPDASAVAVVETPSASASE